MLSNLLRISLYLASAFFLYQGLFQIYHGGNSQLWPKTEGVIIRSELFYDEEKRPLARIEFAYRVGNRQFVSDKVNLSRLNPAGLTERYPRGKRVKVHYNPKERGIAVLEPGLSYVSLTAQFGLALFFFVLSGIFGNKDS